MGGYLAASGRREVMIYEDPKNSFLSICIACAMVSIKAVGQVSGSWDFRAA